MYLQENIGLKVCNLSWNGLGPGGGQMIAEAIAVNPSLEELDISGNRLDFKTAVMIAKGLKQNEDLKVLKVR